MLAILSTAARNAQPWTLEKQNSYSLSVPLHSHLGHVGGPPKDSPDEHHHQVVSMCLCLTDDPEQQLRQMYIRNNGAMQAIVTPTRLVRN